MTVLAGADLVLPDRVVPGGTLEFDNGRVIRISGEPPASASPFAFTGHTIVPGFVDVHVHGAAGVDTLDGAGAVAQIAGSLPAFGVTAFCPTTVACEPSALEDLLAQVRACRGAGPGPGARVLPAHLESNFINPEFRGAQPMACVRTRAVANDPAVGPVHERERFSARDVLRVIEAHADAVAIVTLAPEIDGGLDLVSWLVGLGIRVSLGHSGASYEQACAAFAAGASHATHLFNRMSPLHHRRPGLVGAILDRPSVVAELICDGVHVHPALVRLAVQAKSVQGVMAVSDGTALSGLAAGAHASLGGQPIAHDGTVARLDDGTMAGSVLTMDAAFRQLTGPMGFSLVDAVHLCATTPARALGLEGHGRIVEGAAADLVVLDRDLRVVQTYVDGRLVFTRPGPEGNSIPLRPV